jgi:hypothetical protein
VVVVGTPLYRRKYDNGDLIRGFAVAAEGDLVGKRMLGKEAEKANMLPVLLEGTSDTGSPALLQGRVYADFLDQTDNFAVAFDLILSLYGLPTSCPAVADVRDGMRDWGSVARRSFTREPRINIPTCGRAARILPSRPDC